MQRRKLWWGLRMNRDCSAGLEHFPLVTKEKRGRSCLILKLPCLSWQILDILPRVAFTWSNRDQYLLGEVRWVSARSSHCRTSPPLDEDHSLEGLLGVPGLPSISAVLSPVLLFFYVNYFPVWLWFILGRYLEVCFKTSKYGDFLVTLWPVCRSMAKRAISSLWDICWNLVYS